MFLGLVCFTININNLEWGWPMKLMKVVAAGIVRAHKKCAIDVDGKVLMMALLF